MQARIRHFTKSCVGPDGITFDLVQILKDAKMHGDQDCNAAFHVPSQCLPPRSVWILVWAAKKTLGCMAGKRWHIYVDLTECRPTWVKQHEMFGKAETVTGMEVDAGHWGDDDGLNKLKKQLNSKSEKRLFFTSNTQFWACWEQMAVIWECSEMWTRRDIGMYRYFLMQQQENGDEMVYHRCSSWSTTCACASHWQGGRNYRIHP